MLCDIAMSGDHGIGTCYGSVPELPKMHRKGRRRLQSLLSKRKQ